jgi:hypothetical protein
VLDSSMIDSAQRFFFFITNFATMPQPLKIKRHDEKYRSNNSKKKCLRCQNSSSIAQTFFLSQSRQNNRNRSLLVKVKKKKTDVYCKSDNR